MCLHLDNLKYILAILLPLSSCPSYLLLELTAAIDRLSQLVPDEAQRRLYVRVFKWVVAFASWKYGPESTENQLLALDKEIGDCDNISSTPLKGVLQYSLLLNHSSIIN